MTALAVLARGDHGCPGFLLARSGSRLDLARKILHGPQAGPKLFDNELADGTVTSRRVDPVTSRRVFFFKIFKTPAVFGLAGSTHRLVRGFCTLHSLAREPGRHGDLGDPLFADHRDPDSPRWGFAVVTGVRGGARPEATVQIVHVGDDAVVGGHDDIMRTDSRGGRRSLRTTSITSTAVSDSRSSSRRAAGEGGVTVTLMPRDGRRTFPCETIRRRPRRRWWKGWQKPMPWARAMTAVLIPTDSAARVTSGPPELPGGTSWAVCCTIFSMKRPSSLRMARPRRHDAGRNGRTEANGLPIAITSWPTLRGLGIAQGGVRKVAGHETQEGQVGRRVVAHEFGPDVVPSSVVAVIVRPP